MNNIFGNNVLLFVIVIIQQFLVEEKFGVHAKK